MSFNVSVKSCLGALTSLSFMAASALCLNVQAATISFVDQTVREQTGYGFSAIANPTSNVQGLSEYTEVDGNTYTITPDDDGNPLPTTIHLRNADNDLHPTDYRFPSGTVTWTQYKQGDNPRYTFTLSAGGRFYNDKNTGPYTISLSIDGKPVCSASTVSDTDQFEVICQNVAFTKDCGLKIELIPLERSNVALSE